MKRFKTQAETKDLAKALADTDARLALLKAQLAAQMVKLAGQTNDLAPLAKAEEALAASKKYYTFETTPVEIGMVQTALGNMLMKLGRTHSNKTAIKRARDAYRASLTLASLHGDEEARLDLRDKIKLADSLLGHRPKTQSLFRVA